MKLKKIQTTYNINNLCITVNEEYPDHISVHEYGEPCSGVLKRWVSKEEIIKELENIIKAIKLLK